MTALERDWEFARDGYALVIGEGPSVQLNALRSRDVEPWLDPMDDADVYLAAALRLEFHGRGSDGAADLRTTFEEAAAAAHRGDPVDPERRTRLLVTAVSILDRDELRFDTTRETVCHVRTHDPAGRWETALEPDGTSAPLKQRDGRRSGWSTVAGTVDWEQTGRFCAFVRDGQWVDTHSYGHPAPLKAAQVRYGDLGDWIAQRSRAQQAYAAAWQAMTEQLDPDTPVTAFRFR